MAAGGHDVPWLTGAHTGARNANNRTRGLLRARVRKVKRRNITETSDHLQAIFNGQMSRNKRKSFQKVTRAYVPGCARKRGKTEKSGQKQGWLYTNVARKDAW